MDNMMSELPIGEIVPSKLNPRKTFNEEHMNDLILSIKEKGIIEPIIVRKIDSKYEIVCGERRYKASKKAGLVTIPCIIRILSDEQAMEFQVIENLQREDLGAIEEAKGFQLMLKKCSYNTEALATRIDKSPAYISCRLKLLTLPEKVQDAIANDIISPGHGLVISRLCDSKEQLQLLQAITQRKLSIRAAENALNNCGRELRNIPFDTKECLTCQSNGSKQKDLFDKSTNLKGRCLNAKCFDKKCDDYISNKKSELQKKGFQVKNEAQLSKTIKNYQKHNTKSFGDTNYNQGISYKKCLGAKYVEKCLKCSNHVFVIEKGGYHDDDPSVITERCLNTRCMEQESKKAKSKSPNGQENSSRDAKKFNRVHEAQSEYWINVLLKDKDAHILKTIATHCALSGINQGRANSIFVAMTGIKHKESYLPAWDFRKLYSLKKEQLQDLTNKASENYIENQLRWTSNNAHMYFAEKTGHFISKEFVIKEVYLKAHTKDELLSLAKEIGLIDYLGKNKKKADKKSLSSLSKGQMIDLFLKEGFDLKGKVPKEMLKKK